jgi:type I restriction enzyme R subunit
MSKLNENSIEQVALDILRDDLGYQITLGKTISEGENKEREYNEAILTPRLQKAITTINPHTPTDACDEALKKVLRTQEADLISNNLHLHKYLTEGIDVKYAIGQGRTKTDKIWLIDFANAANNNFLAVNQFTLKENNNNRRADIVLFINGLPIVVIELKNAPNADAGVEAAYNQLQTYKKEIPTLFVPNAFMVISDGWFAKAGTLSSPYNRFMEWKTADGETLREAKHHPAMETLFLGLLNQHTLLDVVKHFIVYEISQKETIKKLAAYHQYYAVNKAITTTVQATATNGRAGVIWHTQGSGKSLSMVFYGGKMVVAQALNNPTIVVLTDRNDLDQQLFETFTRCQGLLRQTPAQAISREDLKNKLAVASGGIVFTTIQKFLPEEKGMEYPKLSDRRNIIVIADEAHRSQYDFVDGYARHMRDALPKATFIGFTGTPIDKEDKSTIEVFGDYIDIYDIQQAVEDGATVRIYYESRLAQVKLSEENQKIVDEQVEELTESDELTERQKRFAKWTGKESVVGSLPRLKQVAADIVQHFEERYKVSQGKAMIVCMSRRICVALHDEIIKLRPQWYDEKDDKGQLKVIMTGSASDPADWQQHIRTTTRRAVIGDRVKNPDDNLKMVIVRDMWLTGFDAPCLNTLYVDKPMSGHNLMQAIARVNRVFHDKEGGLVVDYIGIAHDLKNALSTYTESKGRGKLTHDKEEAVAIMMSYFEVVQNMFGKFEYRKYFSLEPKQKLNFILDAANHIAEIEEQDSEGNIKRNGITRFKENVNKLQKAFGLSVPEPATKEIRDDLAFFLTVRARFNKLEEQNKTRTDAEIEHAIREIVNDAIISEDVVDIFDAAGLKKPDISILSDEFLAEVKGMARKNLAVELLKRLLVNQIKEKSAFNLVQNRKFSEMLSDAISRYQNGLIEAAQVIEELIQLAKELREAQNRGEKLNLREDELAFYDALADNPEAETVLGDDILKAIALELVTNVRKNATIDWQIKDSVQATLRVMVKRILRKYKYPPDDPETGEYTESVKKVLDQAERLAKFWTEDNQ